MSITSEIVSDWKQLAAGRVWVRGRLYQESWVHTVARHVWTATARGGGQVRTYSTAAVHTPLWLFSFREASFSEPLLFDDEDYGNRWMIWELTQREQTNKKMAYSETFPVNRLWYVWERGCVLAAYVPATVKELCPCRWRKCRQCPGPAGGARPQAACACGERGRLPSRGAEKVKPQE